jgi:mannose-6-phosphate isomerase-like protein (cupin superfamily)
MPTRIFIAEADDVAPFIHPAEPAYESQHILGRETTGLHDTFLNQGRLAAGHSLGGGNHPANAEIYIGRSGWSWLDLGGHPDTGEGGTTYRVGADTIVFIPRGTFHRLRNEGKEDYLFLTVWPEPAAPGANGVHDERLRSWGTGFRLRDGREVVSTDDAEYVVDRVSGRTPLADGTV